MRRAASIDIPDIVDMIEDLRVAVSGPVPVDRAWVSRTLAGLLASDDGYVAVTGGGFIAGILRPTIINPALIAQEMGWFARDRSGLRLLRGFEAWASERGATLVQLSTGPEGLDLTRLGYRRAELAWVK
ncbi:hypothetical protein GL286_01035 [Paracoccus aestuariivivens]|uniref:GNAT family N-acetyltransferase n=2 Tax=Paracoccus aestuariivivens TaxID=1820333 RepID=A0A6L6J4Y1_9RHOB|nr:hypothetical protein [Paracoccus aestuariivivens]